MLLSILRYPEDLISNAILLLWKSIISVFDNHLLDLGAGNLLNALLDPILIFLLGLGISGAAISTVISEYVDDVVKLKCLFRSRVHIP